jgi:hypothetical protein
MCGTLKFENTAAKIGNLVAIEFNGHLTRVKWAGFAQDSKVQDWLKHTNARHVTIICTAFDESGITFRMPGLHIEAIKIGHHNGDWVNNTTIAIPGTVKVITRAPLNEFEASIHKRWPAVRDPTNPDKYYQWTKKDILVGQQELF